MHVTKVFERKLLYVDGIHFIDCELRYCILLYNGGDIPIFDGSNLEGCVWQFTGPAARSFELIERLYNKGDEQFRASLIERIFGINRQQKME